MSEKTFLCTECGRWNMRGRFYSEDEMLFWVCDPCQLRAIRKVLDNE